MQQITESSELQQITDMLYVREIAEKFLSTLLRMFIFSCYFDWNARRDTAQEKAFDFVIQMTLDHVLVQRFKKKGIDKTFNKDICKCYKSEQIPLEE